MRRLSLLVALAVFAALAVPSPAAAVDDNDIGNIHVAVPDPAYVTGDLWASSAGVFATLSRRHSCWYPQSWWDDVVTVYEDGAVLEYNTSSRYYDVVASIVARAGGDDSVTEPIDLFDEFDVFADRSCIQAIFIGRDDCSTEDMIGVLSTAAVRDAYRRLTIETGSFDDHDIGGLYCLVVIERDPWLELVGDEALIPEPVRATFPQFRTLVGLENSVWYAVAPGENATAGGFSVGIPTQGNDYTLNLSIWLTGIRIDIDGDGDWEYDRSCSGVTPDILAPCVGSRDDPVFTFEYETRAFHAFTMQTLWAGQAVGPTGEVLNIDPGLLFNEYTFDWETVEVRSSLDE